MSDYQQFGELQEMEKALLKDLMQMKDQLSMKDQNIDASQFQQLLDDPMLSPDFDIINFLNTNYADESSLENIQGEIQKYDQELIDLDLEMKNCIKQQAYAQEDTREQLRSINDEAVVLIEKIQSVRQNARESQDIVEGGCLEIRQLDGAKKNVTHAITTLKKLNMLIVGIEQLRDFCIKQQYRDASDLIRETGHLLGFFFKTNPTQSRKQAYGAKIIEDKENEIDYSNIEELRSLKEEWDHLCNQLRIQILEEFENLEKGIKQDDLLHDACYAIDAMGENAINDVMMQFSLFILRPYQEIFEPGKPDAEFENTRRRFSWLKRTLKEYQEKYLNIFPQHWLMEEMVAKEFCRQTKLHIDGVLSMGHLKIDVSKLVEILQATIEFENDIQKKFDQDLDELDDYEAGHVSIGQDGQVDIQTGSAEEIKKRYAMGGNKSVDRKSKKKKKQQADDSFMKIRPSYRFKGCISEVFEPYLKSYSESEERKIIDTIEGQVGMNDKLEVLDHKVYSSSLRLFKSIKDSMRRCTSFSTSKALFDLQTSFKNVFRHYKNLLKRQIPSKSFDINYETIKFGLPGSTPSIKSLPDKPMSDDVEMKCVYIINTCDYILDIIPQLQGSIEDKIDAEYADKIDLESNAEECFKELIRASINCLVVSLCARNDKIYMNSITKIDWAQYQMSGAIETTQYMREIAAEMQERVANFSIDLSPVYFSLLMNKLASAIPSNFLLNVYKIKKTVNTDAAQQFSYDLQNELKTMLYSLPLVEFHPSNGRVIIDNDKKATESYRKFVDLSIQKVMGRFKVMGYPPDKQAISEGYQTILDQIDRNDKNKSREDLFAILTLRGLMTKKEEFKLGQKLENFFNNL